MITHPELAKKLKRIREGKGYHISVRKEFARALFSFSSTPRVPHVPSDKAPEAIPSSCLEVFDKEEGLTLFICNGYEYREGEIGGLISGRTLPKDIINHLVNINECFLFGFFESAIIYCRALIEAAAYQYRRRCGLIKQDTVDISSLSKSLDEIKRQYKRNNRTLACYEDVITVKELADHILHAHIKRSSDLYLSFCKYPERTSYKCIRITYVFVEEMLK